MRLRIDHCGLLLAAAVLAIPSIGIAQEPPQSPAPPGQPESLPAPRDAEDAEPVVGQLDHSGWALVGPRGRHYVFGGLAVADYTWQGKQHIVTLQQEEPTMLPKPDDNFLYYRELGSGRRWAIGRYPSPQDTYAVYFQPRPEPAAASDAKDAVKPAWTLFQRSRLTLPEEGPAAQAPETSVTHATSGLPCNP